MSNIENLSTLSNLLVSGNSGKTLQINTDGSPMAVPVATVSSTPIGIGYGQTWQSGTSTTPSPIAGTTYYNTSSVPIFVNITVYSLDVTGNYVYLYVNSLLVAYTQASTLSSYSSWVTLPLTAIIPPGIGYKIVLGSGGALVQWKELR